ncbi:MAG: OmpA family protein [Bacteroidia bacterium]|nr:OmpA family protein [Bacteroidia bacterium]
MAKIKTSGRILIIILIVGAIFGAYMLWGNKIKQAAGKAKSGDAIKIGVVTWPGYAAGQYMNNGFDPNTECRYFKDYGIMVEYKVLDDFTASRKAFESGDIDLLWCTVDALPTEMGKAGTLASYNPKFLFQADWSRGGDAIVVRTGIENVNDLKGKTVSVAQGTPSHSFLIELLKTNSLTLTDIKITYVADAIQSANLFKQQAVDAAVVWSPDDIDCVNKVQGAKILANTKTATNIIADGFFAKEEYVKKNEEKLQKLYEGWMVGAAELNQNKDNARKKAAEILAKKFQMKADDALAAMENVRYVTHGDNLNFFGLGNTKAITADALYSKMSAVYQTYKFADNPLPWRDVSNAVLIQKTTTLTGPEHQAEAQKQFTEITKEDKTKKSFSNKKVTINFPSGSFELSGDAKYTIIKEFVDIAKTYGGARIRIEGNTDNTGSAATNKKLSENRAQAVKDFLVKDYAIDPNRIIVVGNGPKHALDDKVTGANEKYRTTDFQLISE